MVEYRDIRNFKRRGRHLGVTYTVLVWADAGKYFISAVDISGYPRMSDKDSPGFDSADEALDAGEKQARDFIDE